MGALKDEINRDSISKLAAELSRVDPSFDSTGFCRRASRGLGQLELKDRVGRVAEVMAQYLPEDLPRALQVVGDAVGPSDLGMWEAWPAVTWVERFARTEPNLALATMEVLTSHATAEFAIRPFIDDNPDGLRRVLFDWTSHRDDHVRRLVSEGTRPRLPWAPRLAVAEQDPAWAVPLLDRLHQDRSEYVRRSVANHLNDLNKVAPELALDTARRWADGASGDSINDLIRHGLRTLIKAGDATALALIGVDSSVEVRVERFSVAPARLVLGERIACSATLSVIGSTEPVELLIDYGMHFRRANGSLSRKVFKLRRVIASPGESVALQWTQAVRPVTVRRYYPGEHRVDLQVNGRVVAEADFELVIE